MYIIHLSLILTGQLVDLCASVSHKYSVSHSFVCTVGKKEACKVKCPFQEEEDRLKRKKTHNRFFHPQCHMYASTSVQLSSCHCISHCTRRKPSLSLSVLHMEAVLPSLTPVLQNREVSTEPRLDVKALALICAVGRLCKDLTKQIFISSCELISFLCHRESRHRVCSCIHSHDCIKKTHQLRGADLERLNVNYGRSQ